MPGDALLQTDSNSSQKPFIARDEPHVKVTDGGQGCGGMNNRWMILAMLASTMGSTLPIGHNIGVINNPQEVIRGWVRTTVHYEYGTTLSPSGDVALWSLIVSLFVMGATIGSVLGASLADRVGRRNGLMLTHLMCLISAVMFVTCKGVPILELLLFGRLLSGIAAGLSTGLVPLYLSEVCPPHLRGVMGAVLPVGLCSGILIAQILGTSQLMGTEELWPILVGGHLFYTGAALLLHPFLPESPTYYSVVLKDSSLARKQLLRLRNNDKDIVEDELKQLHQCTSGNSDDSGWSLMRLIRTPSLRKPLVCVMVLNAGQQLVGINAVFYYSTLVFKSAGLSLQQSQMASLGAAIINVIMASTALILIRYCRRKVLLLISLVLYSGCQLALLLSLRYINAAPGVPYVAIAALVGSVFGYGIGLGPVPYMYGTETFPDGPRGLGLSLGAMSNYICNMIVGFTFPLIQAQIKEMSFAIFIGVTVLFAIFVIIYLPETYRKNQEAERPCMAAEIEVSSFANDSLTSTSRPSTNYVIKTNNSYHKDNYN